MNIFAGARRVSMLLAGAWCLGCVAYAALASPHYTVSVQVPAYGLKPKVVEACSKDDATEHVFVNPEKKGNANGGESVWVVLCFLAKRSESGELVVAYAPATDGKYWIAAKTSQEVTSYKASVAADFELDADGLRAAKEKKAVALWNQWKLAMQTLAGGLAFGIVVVLSVGWVVRGFMGIPSGSDVRGS